jgi:hypothetical protein
MKIQCPKCGEDIAVNGFGRRPLSITVKNVCDALDKHHRVSAAAEDLGCSRAYVYKVLKENNLFLKDFVDPASRRRSKTKQN